MRNVMKSPAKGGQAASGGKRKGFAPIKSGKDGRLKPYLTGFTLIELLIVVAIIGILATVVILNVSGAREKAVSVKIKSDLNEVLKAGQLHLASGNSVSNFTEQSLPMLMEDSDVNQFVDESGTSFLEIAPRSPFSPNYRYSWVALPASSIVTFFTERFMDDSYYTQTDPAENFPFHYACLVNPTGSYSPGISVLCSADDTFYP